MKVKKIIHHIRQTRPKWYTEYHQWEHHATLHWITFAVSCVVILMGFFNVINQTSVKEAHASTTASTNLTQTVNGGSLTISNTGDQSLSSANVSTSNQNTTGSLGTITMTDNRGTGVGWSTTATSTEFYKYNTPVKTGGSNNTLSISSASTPWASPSADTYTVTITGGGSVGTATYSVAGTTGDSSSGTTGADVNAGTHGLKITFASATYTTSDAWTIRVDEIPVTGLQVTPGALTTISGTSTNVTSGSAHTFTTTSDQATLATASSNYGLGSYSVAPSLQLTVPGNSYANSYTATVTETIQ